jgi:hypothetical protein
MTKVKEFKGKYLFDRIVLIACSALIYYREIITRVKEFKGKHLFDRIVFIACSAFIW